jgi:hypothetical protein
MCVKVSDQHSISIFRVKESYGWTEDEDNIKRKVQCTLVQALMFCIGRTAHRGSRGIALHFHDHGTRKRWGVSVTPRPLFAPGKDPIPIVQEARWVPRPVWTGAENLTPTGIRSPGRPAHSQSLYLLSNPTHWRQHAPPKTSATVYQSSRCYAPEDSNLLQHCWQNLRLHCLTILTLKINLMYAVWGTTSYLFPYGLFKDAFDTSEYAASNIRKISE